MKIRSDFVSNSSSSSFVLIGNDYSEEDLIEIAKKHGLSEESCSVWEAIDLLQEKFPDLSIEEGIDSFYDRWCAGFPYSKMDMNETRAQFESRIGDVLESMSGNRPEVKFMEDAGYDG